jgi:hypothetical protein
MSCEVGRAEDRDQWRASALLGAAVMLSVSLARARSR